MDESIVRFPVKCPMCGQESLVGSGIYTILQTLATDRPIKLYANCAHHRVVWVASDMRGGKFETTRRQFSYPWLINGAARAVTQTSEQA